MPGIDVNTANTIVTEYIDYTPKVSDFAEAVEALRKVGTFHWHGRTNTTALTTDIRRPHLIRTVLRVNL
jgi:hypothetical protein